MPTQALFCRRWFEMSRGSDTLVGPGGAGVPVLWENATGGGTNEGEKRDLPEAFLNMGNRWFNFFVVFFWLVSMSWLGTTKILPTVGWGEPNSASPMTASREDVESDVGWEIHWKGSPIGWVGNRVVPQSDGGHKVDSLVQFDELPIGEIVRELFGPLGTWIQPPRATQQQLISPLRVETRMVFDREANLQRFESSVSLGAVADLLQFTGSVLSGRLQIVATMRGTLGDDRADTRPIEIYRGHVELPPSALVADTLSPTPRLRNLHVGQSWTFQAYRPVPYGRPLQLVRAHVEEEGVIVWNGQARDVWCVVFHYADGAHPSAAREPFSRLWVELDGTVLKQRLRMASLEVDFVRLPEALHLFEELR